MLFVDVRREEKRPFAGGTVIIEGEKDQFIKYTGREIRQTCNQ